MKTDVNLNLTAPQNTFKKSLFRQFISKLCPCIMVNGETSSLPYQMNNEQQTRTNLDKKHTVKQAIRHDQEEINKKDTTQTFETAIEDIIRQKYSKQYLNIHSTHQVGNNCSKEQRFSKPLKNEESKFPISSYKEQQILTVGKQNHKLLVKVSSIKILPSSDACKLSERAKKYESKTKDALSNIDKYWNQRYYLFSKFDQGISINENSWPIIIPQSVSEYVASKIKCQVVLNIQCGIGGEAIKLSNSCKNVIAYDEASDNLKCLRINSKIYGAQNLTIINQLAHKSAELDPQVVIISLYNKLNECLLNKPMTSVAQIKPDIRKYVSKAFGVSRNLVVILPADIHIQQIVSIIVQQIENQKVISESCYIKVQKLYFMQNLRYVVIYYGNHFMQQSVTLNDELKWIYSHLKMDHKKSVVDKKIVKKLRQGYGMVKLLNIVLKLEEKQQRPLQGLVAYIKQNNLISEEKLVKILSQQQKAQHKQESNSNNEQNQQQRTVSLVSSVSIPMNRQSFQNKMISSSSIGYKYGQVNRLTYKQNSDKKDKKRNHSIKQKRRQDSQNSNNSNVVQFSDFA